MRSKELNKFGLKKDFTYSKVVIDLLDYIDYNNSNDIVLLANLRNKVENPLDNPFYLISKKGKLYFTDNYNSDQYVLPLKVWLSEFPNFVSREIPNLSEEELFIKGFKAVHINCKSEWEELRYLLEKNNIKYTTPVIFNNNFFIKGNELKSSFLTILPMLEITELGKKIRNRETK
jgi:hypothetical protein